MDIGNKIRELRNKHNLTQEELAVKLSISPQAVSRWECGVSLPDISMIPLLSKTLFVSADELLGCGSSKNQLFDSCNNLTIWGDVLNQDQIDSIFENHDMVSDGTPKKVLVVDDSDFMRMMIRDILEKFGHSVLGASDGKCAFTVLEHTKVDIIILDINMPEMNGVDFLKLNQQPDTKIMMLSAICCESIVKETYELGASAFVAKPFQADSITRRI